MQQKAMGPRTFSVTSNTEELDGDQDCEEDGDPNTDVDVGTPEINGEAGGDEFERKDNEPGDGVVPSNSKSPAHVRTGDYGVWYHQSSKEAYHAGSMKRMK